MKICWDNIENLYLSRGKNGQRYLRIGSNAYIEKTCQACEENFLAKKWHKGPAIYCSRSCGAKSEKHYSPLDEYNEKRLEKMLRNISEWKDFYDYSIKVRRLTETNYRKYAYLINPQGFKRGHSDYHIDHIISVKDGYEKEIPIEAIAQPANLQMLPYKENHKKRVE